MIGMDAPEPLTCSRAGCRETASWRIEWRNPRIHTEDRVKVWLACAEHVDFLREFLAAREFPVRVVPIADAGANADADADAERSTA